MRDRRGIVWLGAACALAAAALACDSPNAGGVPGDGGDGGDPPCACDTTLGTCDPGCACDRVCGARDPGEVCRAEADCRAGLECIVPPGDASGACLQRCRDAADTTCGEARRCIEFGPAQAFCLESCVGAGTGRGSCREGEACYPIGADAGACFRGGDAGLLERCDGTFACAGGLVCTPGGNEGGRLCVRLCDATGRPPRLPPCDAGMTCVPGNEGDGFGVCAPACTDPIVNDCPAGQTCVVAQDGAASGTRFCVPAGAKPQGEPCASFLGECAAGLYCFGTCVEPCRQGGDPAQSGCGADRACVGDPRNPIGVCLATCRDFFAAGVCPQGQACRPAGPWALCTPEGVHTAGAPCTDADPCAAAHVCAGGRCIALCDGAHSCAGEGAVCQEPPGIPVGLCQTPCDDVFGGTGCGGDETCRITDAEGHGACAPVGNRATGDPCADSPECPAGHVCLDPRQQDDTRCHELCEPGAPAAGPHGCGDGRRCVGGPGAAVGICVLAPPP